MKAELPTDVIQEAVRGDRPLRKLVRHRGSRRPVGQGSRPDGEQQTKTKTALEFFSDELRAARG